MAIFIKSDVEPTDAAGVVPFLELDPALFGYRNQALGMLDFSNPDCYAGSGSIAIGQTFTGLTSARNLSTAQTTFPAIAGGMIDPQLPGSPASGKYVDMPNALKLPTNCKKYVAIVWVKLPASGWQTSSGNVSQSLFAYMTNSSTNAQWGISMITVQATGVPNVIVFLRPNSVGANGASALSMSNADTLAVCDGALHQIACVFDGESSPGNLIASIFIDKVSKASITAAWDGVLIAGPATQPRLGWSTAYQGGYPAITKLGRPSLWNLTGSAASATAIIAADFDAAQGYLS